MDKTQHQTPREHRDCEDGSPGDPFEEEPGCKVGQNLHQGWEEAVEVGVSIHVRGTQGQAEVADADDEPKWNVWAVKKMMTMAMEIWASTMV